MAFILLWGLILNVFPSGNLFSIGVEEDWHRERGSPLLRPEQLLTKATLSNLPIYVMLVFKMPKKWPKILKMQLEFLWNVKGSKRLHLMKWDLVFRKEDEGVAIGLITQKNQAPLAKRFWRFEGSSLLFCDG